MNKLTKGAIAGAAGIVLLMGGAGSLAYWTGSADAGSATTINAGQLKVVKSGTDGAWKVNNATMPASYTAVPGDELTFTQTFTVSATGSNLKFDLGLANGAVSYTGSAVSTNPNYALSQRLVQSATYTVNTGAGITAVSGNPDRYTVTGTGTNTITVTAKIKWDFGTVSNVAADNQAQSGSVGFASNAITLTQVAS
ncbi:alternate-type signal peptide domain-containing protein [Schumannella sp. 10F1B-5-1]|uniref:alternate-type signal peptide domain-containing protein n=1 Tax=Schumannella sp. 10F1B-5-1 TaxID=2590780 RepID=UPI002106A8D7|nr:alternate-type signal peptide domain-containing protein [Schumannella sp. 10F1B-5-1]